MAMNFATDIVIANSYTLSHGRKENTTVGPSSFAFGASVTASAYYSHAEGYITTASGQSAHAEGQNSIASGQAAHVEGISTTASGICAHAEGISSSAVSSNSHAEGLNTKAMGNNQHTSGKYNVPHGRGTYLPWLEGTSYYVGDKVVRNSTYYICTEDNNDSEFNSSKWEFIPSSNVDKFAEIIGNGTSDNARSNARALDWDGNEYLKGDLYVNCNADSTGGTKVVATPMVGATDSVDGAIGLVPAPSTGDQEKVLRGDGTWATLPTRTLYVSTAISIPAAGQSKSYNVANMTSSHQLVRWNFSSDSENNPPTSLSWETYSGYFTISNTGSVSPSQTINPVFVYPVSETATARV